MSYYSQNDEERVITEFFGDRKGCFLDIGAYDGIQMSNTRKLLESGWSGFLVEPMWTNFAKLCENCRPFKAQLLLGAVAQERGVRRLWVDKHENREWSTTISSELLNSGSIRKPDQLLTFVLTVTLDDLLNYGPFQFVSMDAEWEDLAILKTTTRKDLKWTELLCVEYRNDAEKPQMVSCLTRLGFEVIHATKENLIAKNLCCNQSTTGPL